MSILMLTGGEFGAAVSRRIAGTREVTLCDLSAPLERIAQLVERHEFVAVATWRPYMEICRSLDATCHRLQRPWSLVEISGSALICGPSIVPGSGAGCYHCFNARTDAHRRDADRLRALRNAYANNPALGPAGYTQGMVAIAAASLLEDATSRKSAGRFRQIDVLTGAVLESRLIALHDCPRCRPQPEDHDPTRRFVVALLPELQRLAP
jgi:bacteriocin biosynthesis cyclodehydratase domain-containing protein